MSWERRVVEAPPSLQWHCWRIVSATLFRRAFGRLGTGSVLVSPRKLHGVDRISIGADCSIYQKSWLHVDGAGSITIGDRAYFAHDVHIHSVDPITIGNGCLIGAGSLIVSAEHTRGDRHGIVPSGAITIGDDVFIGDRSTILGGVTIGDGASVGAGAVVTRDVPPGATVVGPRAKITGEVDE